MTESSGRGILIAAVSPVLLALVQLGVGRALPVTAGYAVIKLIMGNVEIEKS